MNKDKIIKDLKEKNRKLKNQYELQETRLYSSQHKVDKLENEILEHKGIEGQLLTTIDEKNKIINKAREYIEKEYDTYDKGIFIVDQYDQPIYVDEIYGALLNILKGSGE